MAEPADGASEARRAPLQLAFGYLIEGLNAIGTIWIFGLLVLINADIGARGLFKAPIDGVPEIVELSIVGIVFLQAAHTLRVGRLTRADVLFERILKHWPRIARILGLVFNLTGASLFAIIFAVSVPYFSESWSRSLFVGAEGGFTAPTWPVKLITLVGCAAMTAQFLVLAWSDTRAILGRK